MAHSSTHIDTSPIVSMATTTNANLAGSSSSAYNASPHLIDPVANGSYDIRNISLGGDCTSRGYGYQVATLSNSHARTHNPHLHTYSTSHYSSSYNFDDEHPIEGALNHNQRLDNYSDDANEDRTGDLKRPKSSDDSGCYHRYTDEDDDSGNNDDDDDTSSHNGRHELTDTVDENNNGGGSDDGQRVRTAHTSVIMSTAGTEPAETNNDDKQDDKKKPYGGRPLKFLCDKCDRRFHAPSHLKRHMLCHSTERPYKCQVCGKGFLQAWHLGRHMTTHTGNKPFQCTTCPKSFGSRFEMNTHYNYIHKGIKEHQCKVCNKHFTLRSNLKVHMRKHTGEKPYSCHICKKKFGQRGHLQYHLQKHIRDRGLNSNRSSSPQMKQLPSPNKPSVDQVLKDLPPLPMLTGLYPNPPSNESDKDSGVESLGSPPSSFSISSGEGPLGSPPILSNAAHSPFSSERSPRERTSSLSSSSCQADSVSECEAAAFEVQTHGKKLPEVAALSINLKKPWSTSFTDREYNNDYLGKTSPEAYLTDEYNCKPEKALNTSLPRYYNGTYAPSARLPGFPHLFDVHRSNLRYPGPNEHHSDQLQPDDSINLVQPMKSTSIDGALNYLHRQRYSSAPCNLYLDAKMKQPDHRSTGYSCCNTSRELHISQYPNHSSPSEKVANNSKSPAYSGGHPSPSTMHVSDTTHHHNKESSPFRDQDPHGVPSTAASMPRKRSSSDRYPEINAMPVPADRYPDAMPLPPFSQSSASHLTSLYNANPAAFKIEKASDPTLPPPNPSAVNNPKMPSLYNGSLLPPPATPSAFKSTELYEKYLVQLERYYSLLRMQIMQSPNANFMDIPAPPGPSLPTETSVPFKNQPGSTYSPPAIAAYSPPATVPQDPPAKKFRGISDILMAD